MIVAILGPSGVGKTTTANKLGLPEIKSTTTRGKRPSETGDEYHFVSKIIFERLDLIERVKYAGNYYGLQRDDVEEAIQSGFDHFVILDKNGCKIMTELYPDDVKIVYITVANVEILVQRMRNRGDSDDKIIGRLVNIINDKEFNNDKLADFILYSSDLKSDVDTLKKYLGLP